MFFSLSSVNTRNAFMNAKQEHVDANIGNDCRKIIKPPFSQILCK